jgi:benzylsuccinate CoA-transferase BbsF subunit
MSPGGNQNALEGLKVLDFCWVVAGPMTTKYLAEHGATVVRVESSKRPESLRVGAPFRDGISGINRSAYYANYNGCKYGVTIDMRHARARDLVLRIAAWADLVTENFTPGTMESWGLGYEELRKVNQGIILYSTSMLGRGGPMERQPGFGAVMSSMAGITNLTGWPDRSPVNPYGAYTDSIAPRFAIASILAALDQRRRTGQGTHLDMSQLEAALHFSAPFLLDYSVNRRDQSRMGNRDPGAAPHGVYPCQGDDRWIAIACFTDEEWEQMRRLMDTGSQGGQDSAGSGVRQEKFSSLLGRKSSEDELEQLIGEWTKGWDSQELMEALQRAGVPAGKVESTKDLFEDPQLAHRGHFQYPDHPEIGQYATDRSDFNLSRTPGALDRPSPLMGQHNEYVLKELIGLSEEEYQSLQEDDVLV